MNDKLLNMKKTDEMMTDALKTMNYKRKNSSCLKKFIIYSLSFIVYSSASAQQYPVQIIPQLIPPYTTTISQYYSSATDKLAVTLINTDLNKPTLGVRLRMYIESQGCKLISREGSYYPTIQLDAGIPLRLSQSDLAPYFNVDNLDLQGLTRLQYTQQGRLPEGFYTFSFEAIEVMTGRVVGRKTSTMAWITLSDPPLLNLPRKTESIAFKEPQNIIFQWTPRNMSSPNSAFNTEYEFTLVEVWDNAIAPEAAFGMAQPLYRTTTRATTLLYGPSEPPLLPGKRYAWRIQAKASGGMEDMDSYRNGGYSEIYWFSCQSDCQPVQSPVASVTGSRASINWTTPMSATASLNESAYVVEYREKGQDKATWYSTNPTNATNQNLYDLKKDKVYEYRIGRYCGVATNTLITGNREGAVYTDIKSFTVSSGSSSDSSMYNCGKLPPATNIQNQSPLQTLHTGDVVLAGDFPVTITQASGSGSFTGEGYVTIPMLAGARVKVRFSGIGVNTDKQLISGVIETTYDKDEKQVVEGRKVIEQFEALGQVVSELVKMAIDKEYSYFVDLKEKVKQQVEAELPQEYQEKFTEALDKMDEAKQHYDAAKKKLENATTPEEKEAAEKEVEAAKTDFTNAQKKVEELSKEKDALVNDVCAVIIESVKELSKAANAKMPALKDSITAAENILKQKAGAVQKTSEDNTGIIILWKSEPTPLTDDIRSGNAQFFDNATVYYKSANEYYINKLLSSLDKEVNSYNAARAIGNLIVQNGKSVIAELVEMKAEGKPKDEMKELVKTKIIVIIRNYVSQTNNSNK